MSHLSTDTLDLVRVAQAGDRAALERLFERYYPRILTIVRLRLGAKLRQHVESMDILQETFATAVRIFPRFEMRTEASLVQWLSKLAENSMHDLFDRVTAQKSDRAREVSISALEAGDDRAARAASDELTIPLHRAIRDEERDLVESCIEALPAEYRELILLRNYAGLSFPEIAESTARPSEGAARMMHAKAMRELTRLVARRSRRYPGPSSSSASRARA